MPVAIDWPLLVPAGSYEPQYIVIRLPAPPGSPPGTVGDPIDLTAPGWTVTGTVATKPDGRGTALLTLPDGEGSVWRRTAEGRIYFEPLATVTAAWTFRRAFHQVELEPPTGAEYTVRVAAGSFQVSPELVV